MKLLLDENLPTRLKFRFSSQFLVSTVSERKWNANKDQEILGLCESNKIDVFITADKNLIYQQNLKDTKLLIIVLNAKDNRYATLKESISSIENAIIQNKSGVIEVLVN